jgi:cellulose synthase/poly-beta-1,6-N-acetylglucosamine synthase-like glycosyltransferase
MTILTILVAVAVGVVFIPSLTLFLECFAASFAVHKEAKTVTREATAAVLIPAHDEAQQITQTVVHVKGQLREGDRLVVVADNCTDETASLATEAGATVIERFDDERRGKGYALKFGIEWLSESPPDVLVIVDADCSLSPRAIDALVSKSVELDRPIQADYVLSPTSVSGLSIVSALAMLVRNRVRPHGLHRLGLPCHLMGTGMAFPWRLIAAMPSMDAELAEDLVMGVELAMAGHPPAFLPESSVLGELPSTERVAKQQRVRWEHGHLGTLFRYGPRALLRGLRTGRIGLLSTGLDLLIPPVALLVAAQWAVLLVAIGVAALGGSPYPAAVAALSIVLVGVAVLLGWARFGRGLIPFRSLAVAPLYLLWKVPIYVRYFTGRREREWRRTDRS